MYSLPSQRVSNMFRNPILANYLFLDIGLRALKREMSFVRKGLIAAIVFLLGVNRLIVFLVFTENYSSRMRPAKDSLNTCL